VTVEDGEGVLQAHAEPADDRVRLELLRILVLGQVLVLEPAAEVSDLPDVGVGARDLGQRAVAQQVLVERIGQKLPDGLGDRPVFEDGLDVEVEVARRGYADICDMNWFMSK
jgi:hypothetical protein